MNLERQKFWVVPGLFGKAAGRFIYDHQVRSDNVDCGQCWKKHRCEGKGCNNTGFCWSCHNETLMREQEDAIIDKLMAYWSWANEDEDIAGIMPWQ